MERPIKKAKHFLIIPRISAQNYGIIKSMTLVKSKVTNAKNCKNKPVLSGLGATIYCRRVMCPMSSFAPGRDPKSGLVANQR
jgi:hypothetical protein